MRNWDGDWGGNGWIGVCLMMVAFWGVVAWVAVTVLRSARKPESPTARQILDERLARGEISVAEFEELSEALRSGTRVP